MTSMMKGVLLAIVVGFGVWSYYTAKHGKGSCSSCPSHAKARVAQINADDLKQRMETSLNLLVLNVLSKELYDDCHIKGSLNVPLTELEKASDAWKKDQEIVVYCARYECGSSGDAAIKLMARGFTNVKAYESGMKEWREKGYPCEGPANEAYLKGK